MIGIPRNICPMMGSSPHRHFPAVPFSGMPPQCYGWPIHAAHILQIPCHFAPYSCHLRPLAHWSASCALCTIYPSTYPNIHYHCLPVPSAHRTSYTNNPSTYHTKYITIAYWYPQPTRIYRCQQPFGPPLYIVA